MQRAKENIYWFAGQVYARFFPALSCPNDKKKISEEYDNCDTALKAQPTESPQEIKESALKLADEMLQRLEDNPANCVISKAVLGEVLLRIRTIDTENIETAATIRKDLKLININIMQAPALDENKELRAHAIEFVKLAKEKLEKLDIKPKVGISCQL